MLQIRICIAAVLALCVLLTATATFAQDDNMSPLTGQIATDDNSAEAIKLRAGSGNPVAGKDKSLLCQGCHGEAGISLEPLVPSLAGQYGRYIQKQIRNYQAGTRSHQIMNAMAGTLNDENDLADIAAYFASQNKMKGEGAGNDVGKNLFLHGDIPRMTIACVNCHGVKGKGMTPNTFAFPVIGGQQKEYIRRQLMNFRAGIRTNSPNGIMNKITQKLTDDEIKALAEYVSAQ
jgi:cytochrome c553